MPYLEFIFEFQIFWQSQSQPKLATKITHFTIQFCSKNLTHLMTLISLNNAEIILPQHNEKPCSFYQFYSKHVCGWCQRKHLHCTTSKSQSTLFSKHLGKQVSVYSSTSLSENFCFRDLGSFYLVGDE